MPINKVNIAVVTEGGVPNANNVSDEAQKIQTLAYKLNRSNTGQLSYTSASSGISYNTVDNSSDVTIYNKGETGLYNLLIKNMNNYMITSSDIGTFGTATIATTGWASEINGDYSYKLNIAIAGVLSTHIVDIKLDKSYVSSIVLTAGICPSNDSYDGGVTIYAKHIPTSPINFTYTITK